ncbi:MAG: hypothetical protein ACTSYB_01815 [Candidatus Helarchaeota archaeon]
MDDQMRFVGQKLDEITDKLDALNENIAGLINTITTTGQEIGENVKKLAEIIEKYTDSVMEQSKESFDRSRNQLLEISREINTLKRVTGIDQLMRMNTALQEILTLLQNSINPDQIQNQLFEISQFIKLQGGSK